MLTTKDQSLITTPSHMPSLMIPPKLCSTTSMEKLSIPSLWSMENKLSLLPLHLAAFCLSSLTPWNSIASHPMLVPPTNPTFKVIAPVTLLSTPQVDSANAQVSTSTLMRNVSVKTASFSSAQLSVMIVLLFAVLAARVVSVAARATVLFLSLWLFSSFWQYWASPSVWSGTSAERKPKKAKQIVILQI